MLESRDLTQVDEGAYRFKSTSERVLQDRLQTELNLRGFETTQEMVVVPRDRVDVAVHPGSGLQVLTLIEVKIADPIRGVGQVLSYQVGVGQPVHCVLVTSWEAFNSQVSRACTVAEIELWVMEKDEFRPITGPPTLWNAFKAPDQPELTYRPFEPGPVETCSCCQGAGKVREDVTEVRLVSTEAVAPRVSKGVSTGVLEKLASRHDEVTNN